MIVPAVPIEIIYHFTLCFLKEIKQRKKVILIRLYLSGNFPSLSNEAEEQKLKQKIEAYGSKYTRLLTFYYKKEAEVGIKVNRKSKLIPKKKKFSLDAFPWIDKALAEFNMLDRKKDIRYIVGDSKTYHILFNNGQSITKGDAQNGDNRDYQRVLVKRIK